MENKQVIEELQHLHYNLLKLKEKFYRDEDVSAELREALNGCSFLLSLLSD